MKKMTAILAFFIVLGVSAIVQSQNAAVPSTAPRERLLMDFGWRFAFGHAVDAKKDFSHATGYFSYFTKTGYGDGPASRNFDDRAWRLLDLPHDWAVELPFSPRGGYSHGYKTIGRDYPETSIGWYRRKFFIPESDTGRCIGIEFDGVHRNAVVWINGFYVGQEHSGYNGFRYDITDYLSYGDDNVVAVRVDATMEEGWYYEGAGIYRHVWLTKTSPLHIAPSSTFVSSDVIDHNANVTARVTVSNEGDRPAVFDIRQIIVDAENKSLAEGLLKELTVDAAGTGEFSCTFHMTNPMLWSIDKPYLYKLVSIIRSGGSTVDQLETTFGIRTIRFDPNEGFFLNGKHVLLKGTNNHQDHAGVGTAIPDALQEFRISRLKEMGCNAYRCSHNPPTPELLDACDRLGMLVIDENRLMGSNAEHLDLLERLILRDRNHPSVIIWSLGNEEWAIEGNVTGARIASTMQVFAQRLDSSRRMTYANSGWGKGISAVIDVMGFNYIFNGDIDKQHKDFPDQPCIGTEETTSRGTRGIYEDDRPNAHMEATDRKLSSDNGIERGFRFYAARPFLSGLFFWTGFDYRGEPNPFGWPQVASQSGIVDLCGFPKDMFYYLKSWWTDDPVLHLLPHWNWKGKEGKAINVWAYSNCDDVELFLNNKSLGRKTVPKNSHLEWPVIYQPGTLLARGFKNNKVIISTKIETTGDPAAIELLPNRTSIKADGEDISIITVRIMDRKGRLVPTAGNAVSFILKGPGKIIGVGNGDPSSHEPDRYVESVSQVVIENLKAQAVQRKVRYPETGSDYDDSSWPSALDGQGKYSVKTEKPTDTMAIRGTFLLPDFTGGAEISLWPKSLGQEQAVYVNGYLLGENIKRDDPVQEYKLNTGRLRKGVNVYAVIGTPLIPRYQYDDLNTDPGIVQVVMPSGAWKRNVFNGLAQVIVQSSMETGEIVLTASSQGLSDGTLKLQAQPAILRPAVTMR